MAGDGSAARGAKRQTSAGCAEQPEHVALRLIGPLAIVVDGRRIARDTRSLSLFRSFSRVCLWEPTTRPATPGCIR